MRQPRPVGRDLCRASGWGWGEEGRGGPPTARDTSAADPASSSPGWWGGGVSRRQAPHRRIAHPPPPPPVHGWAGEGGMGGEGPLPSPLPQSLRPLAVAHATRTVAAGGANAVSLLEGRVFISQRRCISSWST